LRPRSQTLLFEAAGKYFWAGVFLGDSVTFTPKKRVSGQGGVFGQPETTHGKVLFLIFVST
jgi:hypothetical protein